MVAIIIATLFIAVSLLFFFRRHFGRRLPPGPWGVPFIGYLPVVWHGHDAHRHFATLAKRYGRIVQYSIGKRVLVVLDDYDAIKMAYLDQADTFSGRAPLYLFRVMQDGQGLVALEGPLHVEHRRFALKTLRHLRDSIQLDELMADESRCLVQCFLAQSGSAWEPNDAISLSVANVVCSLAYGRRFEHDDEQFRSLVHSLQRIFVDIAQSRALQMFPVLRFLPPWRGQFAALRSFLEDMRKLTDDIILEHYARYKLDGQITTVRDYIDAYAEQQRLEAANAQSTFTHDQLYHSINSLFMAGFESTSTTLSWAVLLMMHYPQAQRRVQDELDRVVGRARAVTLSDRAKLPLTEATLMEIARWASAVPLGIIRRTMRETTLDGYFVAKGTYVMSNIWSCHRDAKYFPNPDEFLPERFINSQGSVRKNAALLPFAIGKRSCLAESLAQAEIFVFFTNILHRVHLAAPEDDALPSPSASVCGTTLRPLPFKCRPIKRD